MAASRLEERQCAFLKWCGFNLDNGFWSEDVECYAKEYPQVYKTFMENGGTS